MAGSLDWLVPGGALQGEVFRTLVQRAADFDAGAIQHGAMFGPYRVLELLGRGGMSSVYLAERADGAYEQRVALKLLHQRIANADAGGQSLLRRERQILATLDHPGIASLLDGGTTPEGRAWFAMQWVEGTRIDRWCDDRGCGVRERVELLLRVVDAVAHAHARGIVHGDIKPSNILVNVGGAPKLLDFGIASIVGEGESAVVSALTPGSASPEQLRGEPLSAASDVWQLGLLVRRLLGGEHDCVRDVDAIAALATRERREDRYRSAAALGDDLRAMLASRPLVARDGRMAYRFRLLLRRNRVASIVIAAAAIAIAAVATILWVQLVEQRDRALAEGARARAARRFMTEVFRVSDPGINRGETLTANQILQRGRERAADEFRDQPGLRAESLRSIGLVYSELGEQELSQALLDEAVAAGEQAKDLTPSEHAYILNDAAVIRMRRGRPEEAVALVERALAFAGDLPTDDRAHLLLTHASLQRKLGDSAAARDAYERLLAEVDESSDPRLRARGYAQAFLCEIVGDDLGDVQGAVPWCRRAVETFARITEARAVQERSQIQVAYALALGRAGQFDAARAQWQPAFDAELHAYGDGHRRTRYALYVAAKIEADAGRHDAAIAYLDRAEAEPFPHQGRDGVLSAAEQLRGELAMAANQPARAAAAFASAHEHLAAISAPDSPLLAWLDAQRGRALCLDGRFEEGAALLREYLEATEGDADAEADRREARDALGACR